MTFHIQPMDAASAAAITAWHYEGPYAFYDMEQDPEDLAELLDPHSWENRTYAVTDEEGELVGFFCFEQKGEAVEVGLGLRPDRTGKGLGRAFLAAGLAFARETFAPKTFTLSVATFNQRAITLYRQAGFEDGEVFQQETNGGQFAFLRMTRRA